MPRITSVTFDERQQPTESTEYEAWLRQELEAGTKGPFKTWTEAAWLAHLREQQSNLINTPE